MRALWDQEDHQAKNYFRSIRAGAQRRHIDTYLPSSVTNEEKLSLDFIRTADAKRRVVYRCTHCFDRTRLLPALKYIPLEPGGCIRSPLLWNAEYDYPSPGNLRDLTSHS
ncbi:hypothetical protein HZH68_000990 [Vespula germanica]|uniref:Uncharacterized protein n=1 Tax=Vespula germanica TaxID=30212 RepID=A0A834U6J9_VESGE|nr:hypothetical protein HZH68_000990 [Vespula germanica]